MSERNSLANLNTQVLPDQPREEVSVEYLKRFMYNSVYDWYLDERYHFMCISQRHLFAHAAPFEQ